MSGDFWQAGERSLRRRVHGSFKEKRGFIKQYRCWKRLRPEELPGDRRQGVSASGADEAGVQTTGQGDVRGPLNNGPSIGKKGQCVLSALEAQEQVIGPDLSVGLETGFEFAEIDRTAMFVDLHGITSAKSDVRTALAAQMQEVAALADFAGRSWMA